MEGAIPMSGFSLKFFTSVKTSLCIGWLLLGVSIVSAAEIDIRGMKSKGEREVLMLLGGRLNYIRKKEASAWRANDAAFMVQDVLRNDGYFEVAVRGVIESPEKIVLIVDEGQRLSLGTVTVIGDGDLEELKKTFTTPFRSSTPFGAGTPPFRADDANKGVEFVRRLLMSQGYWSAEVSMRKQNVDKQTGLVDMVIAVDEGPRFKIGRPTVVSADGRGVKRAATTWQPFVGQWASTENVNGLRVAMERAFTSRGYPDAEINMTRRLGISTFSPDFVIDLGTRVKLLNVKTEGLVRTKPERVEQIMGSIEGDWYNQAAMNKKVKNLLGTGAFQSVRIETYEVARKRIDATLHFQEARAKEISFAAGASSFDGPLFRASYTDRNFRGALRGFSVGTEVSARGILGELKLTDPWWLGTEILRTHRLYSLIKDYEGYTTYEAGIETSWKYELTDHYSMVFLLGYSYVSVLDEGLPNALLGETGYSHTRASFTQKWDYLDSPILPKSGWHFSIPIQIGAAIGGETNSYMKLGLDGGWYIPINDTYQLGIGGFAQWVSPSNDIQDLPVDLRVFNGGVRSVRSFPDRELGPSFGGDPYGGDFSWAVNTELSRSITGPLRALAFFDAGGVTGDYIPPKQGGLELAVGLGLRVDLPIGPMRLEYGHNLTQDSGEPSGTWHFAIGATF